jgi:hypothetical protein
MIEMATVVGIVTSYLVATEATKHWFFRSADAAPAAPRGAHIAGANDAHWTTKNRQPSEGHHGTS